MEVESWWVDLKIQFFYLFWRRPQVSLGPGGPDGPGTCSQVTFYKINGRNYGDYNGFVPTYSAVSAPQPYWWQDQGTGGFGLYKKLSLCDIVD